jgi:hypothetical protein
MNYRSPVRLVTHAGESPAPFSVQTLSRTRKKVLAEMALSGDELTIDGITYARNDIVTLLDATTSESEWSMHCFLYAHPGLLNFLEQGIFDPHDLSDEQLRHLTPEQVHFLSPYFAQVFNEASRTLLRENSFGELCSLLLFQYVIEPEDSHEAYQRIRIYFDDLIHELKNLSWERFVLDGKGFNFLFYENFPKFVNAIPASFNEVRDTMVFQVILVVERFQHKATWKSLHKVCMRLQDINCGPVVQAEVDKFENVMRRNSRPTSRFSFSGRGAWGILWLVIMVARFFSNDSCNKTNSLGGLGEINFLEAPAVQKIQSSNNNAKNFRLLLAGLSGKTNKGTTRTLANGATPFTGISLLPEYGQGAQVIVTNRTSQDMIVLYFPNWQGLDSIDKIRAAYIKHGDSLTMPAEANLTRLNFIFGTGWVRLAKPVPFTMTTDIQGLDTTGGTTMALKEYFRTTPSNQPYLGQQIVITNFKMAAPLGADTPIGELLCGPPEHSGSDTKDANLEFVEKDGSIKIVCNGDLYVYRQAL